MGEDGKLGKMYSATIVISLHLYRFCRAEFLLKYSPLSVVNFSMGAIFCSPYLFFSLVLFFASLQEGVSVLWSNRPSVRPSVRYARVEFTI